MDHDIHFLQVFVMCYCQRTPVHVNLLLYIQFGQYIGYKLLKYNSSTNVS